MDGPFEGAAAAATTTTVTATAAAEATRSSSAQSEASSALNTKQQVAARLLALLPLSQPDFSVLLCLTVCLGVHKYK